MFALLAFIRAILAQNAPRSQAALIDANPKAPTESLTIWVNEIAFWAAALLDGLTWFQATDWLKEHSDVAYWVALIIQLLAVVNQALRYKTTTPIKQV